MRVRALNESIVLIDFEIGNENRQESGEGIGIERTVQKTVKLISICLHFTFRF